MIDEADLVSELNDRREQAAADPEQRAMTIRARPPAIDPARVLSPEAIAASDRRRAAAEQQEREAEEARRGAAWQAFVAKRGSRYEHCTLANFRVNCSEQEAAVNRIVKYRNLLADNIEAGIGIVLYGPVGTGKDHLLIELVWLAIKLGKSVAWMNGGDMFGMFRDNMDADEKERVLVDRLVRPDVLYVSDPMPPLTEGRDGSLPWFRRELLYRIIDARYSRNRPLWVTMNVSGSAELDERMGAECGTRLRDGAVCLFCNWPCERKPANPQPAREVK